MGRILKKKDPEKKKALRSAKSAAEMASSNGNGESSAARTASVVKKAAPPVKVKTVPQEPNVFQKSIQFLREVRVELKKVTWPSRKQTMGSTVVVLVLWMVISVFLGMVDFSLSSLMQVVLP
jgi:preprotein translocase subunit SecE